MPRRDSADQIVDAIEQAGIELSPEERNEIALYHKGRDLAHAVNFDGWDVAMEMLQSYVSNAISDLMRIPVGDPTVSTAHAAASAVSQLYSNFVQDVQAAISASEQMPDSMKRGLKVAIGQVPINS